MIFSRFVQGNPGRIQATGERDEGARKNQDIQRFLDHFYLLNILYRPGLGRLDSVWESSIHPDKPSHTTVKPPATREDCRLAGLAAVGRFPSPGLGTAATLEDSLAVDIGHHIAIAGNQGLG